MFLHSSIYSESGGLLLLDSYFLIYVVVAMNVINAIVMMLKASVAKEEKKHKFGKLQRQPRSISDETKLALNNVLGVMYVILTSLILDLESYKSIFSTDLLLYVLSGMLLGFTSYGFGKTGILKFAIHFIYSSAAYIFKALKSVLSKRKT